MFDVKRLELDISGIRMFGSLARGDIDHYSDRDILILIGSHVSKITNDFIGYWYREGYDISVYSAKRYQKMHKSGHLFTWHIFHESKPLDFDFNPTNNIDLIHRLDKPSIYQNANSDSLVLFDLLNESIDSLSDDCSSEIYEAGLLYIIARNLAIINSWQLGDLCFSVYAPYIVGDRLGIPFPLCKHTYERLRHSRKASTGLLNPPSLEHDELLMWAISIKKWAVRLRIQKFGGNHVQEIC